MKTDHQLKKDVMDELAWEPFVNDTEIGVEVKDGVVTLTGHLSSYAEKHAAERAAQRVEGVKGLAVEIDVKLPGSSQRNDTDIARTAQHALEWNALVPHDRIKLMVEDGWITLSGEVDHGYQRMSAESALRNLMGIKGIRNQIKIKLGVTPKNVKSTIEAALHRRVHAEAQAITVSVDGNQVTLSGSVPSLPERRAAALAASFTPGVAHVIDHLVVV